MTTVDFPDSLGTKTRSSLDRAWNHGDFEPLRQSLKDEVTVVSNGLHMGSLSVVAFEKLTLEWRAAFPDLHVEFLSQVSEGNMVVDSMRFTGTHTGEPLMGIPPSGRRFAFRQTNITEFEDGLAARLDYIWDRKAFETQLQVEFPFPVEAV